MNKLFATIAFATVLGFALPVMAASESDCKAKWDKADINKDGVLEGPEATAYLDAITHSSRKYEMKVAGKLSAVEFMIACKDDAFKNVAASL